MFRIEDIITGDFSSYPGEAQKFMEIYTEKLRESLKHELVNDMTEKILGDIEKGNETFISVLTEVLENGSKGLNEMSTQKLINMYLERKDYEEFISLLEKVSNEME
jgi:transcription elongation factor GreA-like protein